MTRKQEQLRKAMLRYLEGSIHPEELEVLNRVVETDPEARRGLAELMLQDALLTKVSRESEFFELDEPRGGSPVALSCRTSRIMKGTRRAAPAEALLEKRSSRRVFIAAAALLFAATVAMAVRTLRPDAPPPEPVPATVLPIVPVAPAAAAPRPEEPAAQAPAKVVPELPPAPSPAVAKPKPAAKPKTSTARKEAPEPKPATTVPDGYLTLPSSDKLPPSPSKPAPKLPPNPPSQK
jgi:hypothetical protein